MFGFTELNCKMVVLDVQIKVELKSACLFAIAPPCTSMFFLSAGCILGMTDACVLVDICIYLLMLIHINACVLHGHATAEMHCKYACTHFCTCTCLPMHLHMDTHAHLSLHTCVRACTWCCMHDQAYDIMCKSMQIRWQRVRGRYEEFTHVHHLNVCRVALHVAQHGWEEIHRARA